jgi:hypothetical protein
VIKLNINKETTLKTIIESDRNFYAKASNLIYKALKSGADLELYHVQNGHWSMVHAVSGGVSEQLTKKQIRTADLKFYFGE